MSNISGSSIVSITADTSCHDENRRHNLTLSTKSQFIDNDLPAIEFGIEFLHSLQTNSLPDKKILDEVQGSTSSIHYTREYRDLISALKRLELVHRQMSPTGSDIKDHDTIHHFSNDISFLQYIATDDMIFRIFSFLNCRTIVNTMSTCTRLYDLSIRYATNYTTKMRIRRQLTSPMQLLQAYENILGDELSSSTLPTNTSWLNNTPIPIPILLPNKPIRVTQCGDPEYNGMYYCTGCNGNGYVFTKPRYPMQRRSIDQNDVATNQYIDIADCNVPEIPGQPLRCIIAKRYSNEVCSKLILFCF
jgi:hypothetical protein